MYKKIVIANDGSAGAEKAFAAAIDLCKRFNAPLHMISVEELPYLPSTIDEVVEDKLDADHRYGGVVEQARRQAAAERVQLEVHLVAGHPVPAIADFINQERCDLLVIGFMGHSAIYHRLIGSTTDRLVEVASCAVLVVK